MCAVCWVDWSPHLCHLWLLQAGFVGGILSRGILSGEILARGILFISHLRKMVYPFKMADRGTENHQLSLYLMDILVNGHFPNVLPCAMWHSIRVSSRAWDVNQGHECHTMRVADQTSSLPKRRILCS